MNTEEKIEAAGKKKEEGNVLFKSGKYLRASKRYEKVSYKDVYLCAKLLVLLCQQPHYWIFLSAGC